MLFKRSLFLVPKTIKQISARLAKEVEGIEILVQPKIKHAGSIFVPDMLIRDEKSRIWVVECKFDVISTRDIAYLSYNVRDAYPNAKLVMIAPRATQDALELAKEEGIIVVTGPLEDISKKLVAVIRVK